MTTETTLPVTTSDERVMAALAHFFGLIAALIVYVLNKDRSRFVRFQSLQALALDGLWMVLSFGLMICWLAAMMVGMALGVAEAVENPASSEMMPLLYSSLLPWLMFMCMMPFSLVYWILRLIACISVATGHDFRYPFIAKQVEAFLKND